MASPFRALLAAAALAWAAGPAAAQSGARYYWRNSDTNAALGGSYSTIFPNATFPNGTAGTTAPDGTNSLFFVPYSFGAAATAQPDVGAGVTALSATFGPTFDGAAWAVSSSAATGTPTLTLGGTGSTGLTLRGAAAVTFNGVNVAGASSTSTLTVDVGRSSTLTLAGTSAVVTNVSTTTGTALGAVQLGGSLVLDNRGANVADRLANAAQLYFNGGRLSLVGNGSAPTTETVAATGASQAIVITSGQATINVLAVNGQTATLTLGSSGSGLQRGIRAVINFTNQDDAGNVVGTLGGGAGNPNIAATLGTFVARTNGGAAAAANTTISTSDTTNFVGGYLVNNRDFATLVGGSVVATVYLNGDNVAGAYDSTPASTSYVANVTNANRTAAYAPTGDVTLSASLTPLALKITSDDNARALAFTGTGTTAGSGVSLITNALLLAGDKNFTLDFTGSTGAFAGVAGSNTRIVTVEKAGTVLEIRTSASSGTATAATTYTLGKAGDGTLFMNGPNTSQNTIGIGAGVLRATAGFLTTNGSNLELRGGVLELSGGVAFARALGTALNGTIINWTNTVTPQERGSGGFSAVGGNSTATLSSGATLTWASTSTFVSDGQSLIFGSTLADSRLDFTNPLGLDAGTAALPYTVREVRVNDNPNSPTDVARFSGVVSGSASSDLLKTGPGVLELTNTNTYAGQTLVQGGTLRLAAGGSVGAGAGVTVSAGGRLEGAGTVTPAVTVRTGGTIAPGVTADAATPSTGTLSAGGAVAVAAGATFRAQLNGAGAGAFGRLSFAGPLDVTGATLSVSAGPAFAPALADRFVIADNTGSTPVAGRFAGLADGATGTTADGRFEFTISYFSDAAGVLNAGGNGIALYNLTAVPEPGTALGLAAAGLGLAGWVRRRRTGAGHA